VVAAAGALFGVYERQSVPQFVLTVPEIIWEASFGIYLAVKGFRSPALRNTDRGITASPAAAVV